MKTMEVKVKMKRGQGEDEQIQGHWSRSLTEHGVELLCVQVLHPPLSLHTVRV